MRRIRIDVSYHKYGYDVEVVDVETEQAIDTYEAGNCQGESTTRVSPDDPLALSVTQIAACASVTLWETLETWIGKDEATVVSVSMKEGENDTDET